MYENKRREPDADAGNLYYEYMLLYIAELQQTQIRLRDAIMQVSLFVQKQNLTGI